MNGNDSTLSCTMRERRQPGGQRRASRRSPSSRDSRSRDGQQAGANSPPSCEAHIRPVSSPFPAQPPLPTEPDLQDPKVIPQIRPRHPQRPHAAPHQHRADRKQARRDDLDLGVAQRRQGGLVREGGGVEVVAEDAEGEDGQGEGVAAEVGVVEGEAGEGVVFVLCDGEGPAGGGVSWPGAGWEAVRGNELEADLCGLRRSRRAGSAKQGSAYAKSSAGRPLVRSVTPPFAPPPRPSPRNRWGTTSPPGTYKEDAAQCDVQARL